MAAWPIGDALHLKQSFVPFNKSFIPFDKSFIPFNKSFIPFNKSSHSFQQIFHSFRQIFHSFQQIFHSFQQIFPSFQQIFPSFQQIFPFLSTNPPIPFNDRKAGPYPRPWVGRAKPGGQDSPSRPPRPAATPQKAHVRMLLPLVGPGSRRGPRSWAVRVCVRRHCASLRQQGPGRVRFRTGAWAMGSGQSGMRRAMGYGSWSGMRRPSMAKPGRRMHVPRSAGTGDAGTPPRHGSASHDPSTSIAELVSHPGERSAVDIHPRCVSARPGIRARF
jgi:hypothetical protein